MTVSLLLFQELCSIVLVLGRMKVLRSSSIWYLAGYKCYNQNSCLNIFFLFSLQVKIWFQNKRSKFKKIYKTQGPGAPLAGDAELAGEMQNSLALMGNGPESPASPASNADHTLDSNNGPNSTGPPPTPTPTDGHNHNSHSSGPGGSLSSGGNGSSVRPNMNQQHLHHPHHHQQNDRPHSHQSPAINPELQQTLKCEMMNSPGDVMSQQRDLMASPREMMTSPPMPSPKDMIGAGGMQGNPSGHGGGGGLNPGGQMDPRRMTMDTAGHVASYPISHPHSGHPGHPQWDPASTYMYWNHYGDMAAAHQINQQIMT